MAETLSHLPSRNEVACSSPHSHEQVSSPPRPPLKCDADHRFDTTLNLSEAEEDALVEHETALTDSQDRRVSIISSVSSFPASVLHHEPIEESCSPLRPPRPHATRHESVGSFTHISASPKLRGYASGFRNPSSVRAMQMRDELGDDSESATPHRRSGSQYSIWSHGSAHSSPTKRFSRSSQSSPLKKGGKLKKEFPLVLLHCSLLPASTGILSSMCDPELFGALLPEEYRKRWAALQERIAMAELNARGILIPHPQEDYELLEERLLESLDLEKPRIRSNHFLHQDRAEADSGFESASQTDEEPDSDIPCEFQCPDCGKGVGPSRDRKWEIKVYAANGLMRAGAWAAAWREMEKVDVEIGIWMPEDVRSEVSARLEALRAAEDAAEPQPSSPEQKYHDLREREIYGSRHNPSHHSMHDSFLDEPDRTPSRTTACKAPGVRSAAVHGHGEFSIAGLHQNRRNIAIIMLGVVLMYLITGMNNNLSVVKSGPTKAVARQEITTTILTSTVVVTGAHTASTEDQTTHSSDISAVHTQVPEKSDVLPSGSAETVEIPSLAEELLRDQDED